MDLIISHERRRKGEASAIKHPPFRIQCGSMAIRREFFAPERAIDRKRISQSAPSYIAF